jgi:H+-transporting ATPase
VIASVFAAMVSWMVANIRGIGWRWTGAVWVYNIVIYLFLDPIKFAVRYGLTGKAWNLIINRKVTPLCCLIFFIFKKGHLLLETKLK